jgi:hypothetical protein
MSRRSLTIPAVLLLLAAAGPARAEVKDATASGFTVVNAIRVPVEPTKAWKALVDDVDRWWPADHTWWGLCERHGVQQALHMLVTMVDPGTLLGGTPVRP